MEGKQDGRVQLELGVLEVEEARGRERAPNLGSAGSEAASGDHSQGWLI